MNYTARELPVKSIFLDHENPRHEPLDSEPEILQQLVTDEHVVELATSMVNLGGLSPIESFAVISHPTQAGRYIALEGNRRLSAIKLLADPERAPNEKTRKIFRNLKKRSRLDLENIRAIHFKGREAARPWLQLRHGNDPAGTRKFNAIQTARWDKTSVKPSNPNALALQVVEHGVKEGLITTAEAKQINLTTVTRFLSNPLVRDAVGVGKGKALTLLAPKAEVNVAVGRFLKDALENAKGGVNSRADVDAREAYAHKLRNDKVATTTRTAPALAVSKPTPASVGKEKKQRDGLHPDFRRNVIPSTFSCTLSDNIHKRIYRELKDIDAEQFPFAAAYLLRAMVEMSTKAYIARHRITRNPHDKLHVLIDRAANHLKSAGHSDKELKTLRVMAKQPDAEYSPETLGHAIHGGAVPTRAKLNAFWDGMAGGISLLIKGAI